jgi:hypothetical protein
MECSGCSGIIRAQMGNELRFNLKSVTDSASERVDLIAILLSNFSIFESVDEFNLSDIVPLLKIKRYPNDSIVLKRKSAGPKFLHPAVWPSRGLG